MRLFLAVVTLAIVMVVVASLSVSANGNNSGKLKRDCFAPKAYVQLLSKTYWDDPDIPSYEAVGFFGGVQVFRNRSAKSGPNRVMCAGYFRWTGDARPDWSNSYDDHLNRRDRDEHRLEDIWRASAGRSAPSASTRPRVAGRL